MINPDDMKKHENIDDKLRNALHIAYDRIKTYHEKQLPKSWLDFEENGTILGQKVTPVDRAGLYIPRWKSCISKFTFNECNSQQLLLVLKK